MIERKDIPAAWYLEGMEVTETETGIEISACVLKHNDDVYPFGAVSFDLVPDNQLKVVYELFIGLDVSTNKMEYILNRSYVDPDGYYPGYSGNKRLIHTLLSIAVDTDGNRTGEIFNFHK
ncbi:hypothetical protein [Bacillus sonorensis]|uniref:hypothetical protein n=1 Tax=Bacillus sonorensis TaxID=119858 RepID=UPI001F1DE5FE|nr:hypothetical protein [Bacillus sonorensis]MCF7617416.1 hypothetical protein [Bacillus sonorensis]MCY8035647.1 hypothetical protein [Bacillus sonorensis]MCY8563708.1 hypothetical protein [Bacillus sonorensis]